jgi:hypothetical protein
MAFSLDEGTELPGLKRFELEDVVLKLGHEDGGVAAPFDADDEVAAVVFFDGLGVGVEDADERNAVFRIVRSLEAGAIATGGKAVNAVKTV